MKKVCLILVFSLICSCVYFNTFYNAEKYYTEAKSAKEKNDNKINTNIKRAFDKSIAKCAYVIKEYPKSKYVDDALLLMGQCFFEQENYLKALKKFQEIEQYYSDSPLYPTAKLYLARTYLRLKIYDKANDQFQIIFHNERFISVRELAYLDLSAYYLQKKDFMQAKNLLEHVVGMKSSKESYINALFQYAQIEYLNEEYESALRSFKKVLSHNPKTRMKLNTRFSIGESYMKLNQYKKAKKQFTKLKKDETNSNKLQEIDLQIAICNANLEKFETAFSQFETITRENKGKKIASEAYYYWGDVYFFLLHDYQNAVEEFQKVKSKNQNDELASDALRKIKIANQFITYQASQNSGNILDLTETQFKIAEYYNLDLALPDSAIAIYDRITEQLPNLLQDLDSLKAMPDTNRESHSLRMENKSDSCNVISDTLSANEKEKTPDSLSSISMTDTSGYITDTLAIQSISDSTIAQDSLEIRIKNLQNIIVNYQNEIYPKALFLKTWILLNSKKDTIAACKVVKRLQKELPESKYTFAAQEMIHNEPVQLTTQYEIEAQSYFNKSLNYFDNSISLEKCITYLDTVITMYPESIIYPKALYTKTYLLIKDLSDTTQAKPYLKELLEDFPQFDLTNYITTFFDGENFIKPEKSPSAADTLDTSYRENTPPDTATIKDKSIPDSSATNNTSPSDSTILKHSE
jgi:tetratricopeptide (TPR) repeat protein